MQYQKIYEGKNGGYVEIHPLCDKAELEVLLPIAKRFANDGYFIQIRAIDKTKGVSNPDFNINGKAADYKYPKETENPSKRISKLIHQANKQGASIVILNIDNPNINFGQLKKALKSSTQKGFNSKIENIWIYTRNESIIYLKREEIEDNSFIEKILNL